MSLEANKALCRAYVDAVANKSDLAAIDRLLAPAYVEHDPPPLDTPPGRAGVRAMAAVMRGAFPDLRATVEDILAEGDRVMLRVRFQGTQQGALMWIPPSGRAVDFEVVDIYRVAGDQIVEHWTVGDRLTMLQQLGALPTEPPAPAGEG
jgi:predicted ester cyclase